LLKFLHVPPFEGRLPPGFGINTGIAGLFASGANGGSSVTCNVVSQLP